LSFDPRFDDACKITKGEDAEFAPTSQMLHLVGDGSLHSICAFLAREQADPKALENDVIRYITSGTQFSHEDCSQTNTFQFVSLMARDYAVSNSEMDKLSQLMWEVYKQFGVECRIMLAPANKLTPSEVCRYDFEVKIPSSGKWLACGRISHHGDYILRRFGLKLMHLVEGIAFDSDILLSALIESHQRPDGTFSIPAVIDRFMYHH